MGNGSNRTMSDFTIGMSERGATARYQTGSRRWAARLLHVQTEASGTSSPLKKESTSMGGWGRSGVFGAQPPVLHSLGAPSGRPQPPPRSFSTNASRLPVLPC